MVYLPVCLFTMTANIDWRPSYFHTESIDDDCMHGRVETEEQLTSTLECHKRSLKTNFVVCYVFGHLLTRFNKIAISNNKFQMASGQGSQWLIESSKMFSSMCSPPLSDICQFYF